MLQNKRTPHIALTAIGRRILYHTTDDQCAGTTAIQIDGIAGPHLHQELRPIRQRKPMAAGLTAVHHAKEVVAILKHSHRTAPAVTLSCPFATSRGPAPMICAA